MTAQEQINYDKGVQRAKNLISADGVPLEYKLVSGYGVSWTTQAGVAKSGRIDEIDQPGFQDGYKSVMNQAMNVAGSSSGLPTAVASTNAPPENTGTATMNTIAQTFSSVIPSTTNGNKKWLVWLIVGAGAWFLYKRFKKRR